LNFSVVFLESILTVIFVTILHVVEKKRNCEDTNAIFKNHLVCKAS